MEPEKYIPLDVLETDVIAHAIDFVYSEDHEAAETRLRASVKAYAENRGAYRLSLGLPILTTDSAELRQ